MENYFKAVTLGAFTWKDQDRIALFFEQIRKTGVMWLLLHFCLLTLCLDFPVTLIMARLDPFSLYSRLYGDNLYQALPESARAAMEDRGMDDEFIEDFNVYMIQNGYSRQILLPLLGMAFGLTVIIQAAFYLCAVFFLRLSRLHASHLSLRERFGLAIFSSTLPTLAAAIIGLFLPAVHIIVCYFAIMFFIFQRSRGYN